MRALPARLPAARRRRREDAVVHRLLAHPLLEVLDLQGEENKGQAGYIVRYHNENW